MLVRTHTQFTHCYAGNDVIIKSTVSLSSLSVWKLYWNEKTSGECIEQYVVYTNTLPSERCDFVLCMNAPLPHRSVVQKFCSHAEDIYIPWKQNVCFLSSSVLMSLSYRRCLSIYIFENVTHPWPRYSFLPIFGNEATICSNKRTALKLHLASFVSLFRSRRTYIITQRH